MANEERSSFKNDRALRFRNLHHQEVKNVPKRNLISQTAPTQGQDKVGGPN